MPRAIWNGAVIAESDDTVEIEGNHYFPIESVRREHLVESDKHTVCPWKGAASYFTLEVDGEQNVDAAWYYLQPKRGAEKVRGRVAFWRGVKVVTSDEEPGAGRRRGLLARLLRAA
jgi:uncharacterized protein (DUF427 family)